MSQRKAWLSADPAWKHRAKGDRGKDDHPQHAASEPEKATSERGNRYGEYASVATTSDVDLFLYGLTEREATAKLAEIYDAISERSSSPVLAVKTKHAVTFVQNFPARHIQVILRLYSSPLEVLVGFDIDSCCVAFDGERAWALPRAVRALNLRANTTDVTRRSLSYETRLHKYTKRGFGIVVPELRREAVDPALFDLPVACVSKYKQCKGLRVLLLKEEVSQRPRWGEPLPRLKKGESPEASRIGMREAFSKSYRPYWRERQHGPNFENGGHLDGATLEEARIATGAPPPQLVHDMVYSQREIKVDYENVIIPFGR